ncbi:MAG: NAD(+)--dinitrogen-reductase ADP-D-ribosyltransferase [Nitrospinae bacterium]|nr:NAD(+)--dinitrogen-reductase ADP-D-ribosyltransferase [Nitrospinota bacterium]
MSPTRQYVRFVTVAHDYLTHTNLINVPTAYFASPAFNLTPAPIHINGVREMNAPLFETLDRFGEEEAPKVFMEHMRVAFELDAEPPHGAKRSYRASYLRLLRGWLFDSNRPEGAVMKGWAESRFGLRPLYHAGPIPNINCDAYYRYVTERMNARFNNNAIHSQLDLLYEYCQYWLRRFGARKEKGRRPLYRGVNRVEDDSQIIEKRDKRRWIVRNNSLVSYTADKERAGEFGDTILKIEAPYEKIICFPGLLPGGLPASEGEHLVLGGDYVSETVEF